MHGNYAHAAALCGQWAIADDEFQLCGDQPDWTVYSSPELFRYWKRKVHRLASTQPASEAAIKPITVPMGTGE